MNPFQGLNYRTRSLWLIASMIRLPAFSAMPLRTNMVGPEPTGLQSVARLYPKIFKGHSKIFLSRRVGCCFCRCGIADGTVPTMQENRKLQ